MIRETVPDKTTNVGDNDGQQSHFEDVHDCQNGAIVGNLVISVLVTVALLEPLKKTLFWDEVGRSQSGDTEHFERYEISLELLFFLRFVWEKEEPWNVGEGVEDELTVQDVASGNHLERIYDFVVLGVRVGCEEVEDDFNEEDDLTSLEEVSHVIVVLDAKSHDVEVQQHIWDHNDGNENVEKGQSSRVCGVKNVPKR